MDKQVVINVKNVYKTFEIKEKKYDSIRSVALNMFRGESSAKKIEALQNVSFEIKQGEFFGIIGHNGSGKSTLLKLLIKAFPPDPGGEITINGKMIRLALGVGFDPLLSARENIYINGSILGLTFREIGQKFSEIIAFAELQNFVDTQVKFFSTGMRTRLAFAIAVHADADIYLMDEFFGGVGDERFKEKSREVFTDFISKEKTFIHVSHNMHTIREYCDRVMILNAGRLIGIYSPEEAVEVYQDIMKNRV